MIPWMNGAPAQNEGASDFDFGVTDLEEELRGARGEERRAQVVKRFSEIDAQVKARMSEGIPVAEFQACRIVREALAYAQKVMVNFK